MSVCVARAEQKPFGCDALANNNNNNNNNNLETLSLETLFAESS
jgi:hypothetical protein